MKKINIFVISIVLLITTVTGCSGTSDYTIDLINGYYVSKTSAYNLKIYKKDSKDTKGTAPTIPIYYEGKEDEFEAESVVSIGQDKRYILAKTNKDKYYILDTEEDQIFEALTTDEFEMIKKKLDISNDIQLKNVDEYDRSN